MSTIKSSMTESSKCPSCTKSVYHVEEIICSGSTWHKDCFKCGGAGDFGCQRKLNLSDFTLNTAVPYCKGCYIKVISKPVVAADEIIVGASSGSDRTDLNDLNGFVKISERRSSFGASGKACVIANALAIVRLACPKCTKTVFKAEEIQLAGFSWHKACFTCGGASETDGCKKTLNAQDFHPHRGNPFCKGCIGKQSLVKKMDSTISRIDTDSSETAASETVAEVKESPIQKIQVPKAFGAPSPTAQYATENFDRPPSVTVKEIIRRNSTQEATRVASKGDVHAEYPKSSPGSHAEATAGALAAATGSANSPMHASPVESPAVSAATVPVVSTSAPVVAIASPTTTPTIATVVAIDGRPKDVEREETAEHEDIETTYQDENGVPCTKDGEPLTGLDSVTLNSDSTSSGKSISYSYYTSSFLIQNSFLSFSHE